MEKAIRQLELDKILEQVARFTSFSLGKEKVLNIYPRTSKIIIERELNRTKDAMSWLTEEGDISFGGVKDVNDALVYASKGGTLSIEEIIDVGRMLRGSKRIQDIFNKGKKEYPYLKDLMDSLGTDLTLIQAIDHSFGEGGTILDRASNELRTLREQKNQNEKNLEDKTQEFLRRNQSILTENVVTYYHGRRSFLIKPGDKNKLDGTILGESSSGQSIYFEPRAISRIQSEGYQIQLQIDAEEERICREISGHIGEKHSQIAANLDTLALLDSIFAKGHYGNLHMACIPVLTTDSLDLRQARHPLIDPKQVVANDYSLQEPHRVILISGPNTGGKSVALKTIGLSVLMTMSGLPVLADSAKIMLVDNIFVDIGDSQSIEKSLSSFSAHIETITDVIERATAKSLILLDELGSQTDPLEGESLSMAILDYFREVGCLVVATTHFSKLKQYGTSKEDILIASLEFNLKTLSPTYRYRENILGESNAFAISKRLNLKDSIIDQAFVYKSESQYEQDHLLEVLESKIQETEDLKDTLQNKEQELIDKEESLEKYKETLRLDNEKLQKELEVKYELETAKMVEEAKKALEVVNTSNRPDYRKKIVQELETTYQEPVIKKEIQIGDRVRLESTQQVGIVETIERKEAFVSVGGMRIKVPTKRLEVLPPLPKKAVQKKKSSVKTISSMKLELNLIGMRALEAQMAVDKYLDECVVHKVSLCRIVHGHGSGTLRKMVHEELRKNKNVASFELAQVNEGGSGATVVTFK